MARKSIKIPTDPNQNAARIVAFTTGQGTPVNVLRNEEEAKLLRSQAASILGKLGGSKGGFARAKNLTKERQVEIAKKAATARWKEHRRKTRS